MGKQILLPGTTPRRIALVHDAAEDLLVAQEQAKAARERVKRATEDLVRVMKKSKLPAYHHSGIFVKLSLQYEVKVQRVDPKPGFTDVAEAGMAERMGAKH